MQELAVDLCGQQLCGQANCPVFFAENHHVQ